MDETIKWTMGIYFSICRQPCIFLRDPRAIITLLEVKYSYKLKCTGSISYHLRCYFFRDDEDILCMAPKKYIEKINDGYTNIFNKKPSSKYKSPLEKGDHSELDTTELLDEDGIHIYQSLIGSLQWVV